MQKMHEGIKAQWTEALRSGRYMQGDLYLAQEGKYCCLGVLCDLAVEAGVVERFGEHGSFGYGISDDEYTQYHSLPLEVMNWAGLTSTGGALPTEAHEFDDQGYRQTQLYQFNDQLGKNFEQLADIIDEYL